MTATYVGGMSTRYAARVVTYFNCNCDCDCNERRVRVTVTVTVYSQPRKNAATAEYVQLVKGAYAIDLAAYAERSLSGGKGLGDG